MRRRRYQKGSLQERRHGKKRVWVVQYYDADGHHRYHTLGRMCDLSKSQAVEKQSEFMRTMNGGEATEDPIRPVLVSEFVNQVYLPFQRGKWKESTKETSEQRIRVHLLQERGNDQMGGFSPSGLQAFLERKAATMSFSVVDHLRWDLGSLFEMAVAEKVIAVNRATTLYTPKAAKTGFCRVMTAKEVEVALGAVAWREEIILRLAIFSGFRPGELLAFRRRHVGSDGSSIEAEQRIYRGNLDSPKNGKTRIVAIPSSTAGMLCEWMNAAVESDPNAWIFASEAGETPVGRDNLLRRNIRPRLEKVGLGWVDFKVMRRTNASLGKSAKVDPKASADQRGQGIGVSLDVYTKTSIEGKAEAAQQLEDSVLGRKVVPIRQKMAS